MTSEPISGTSLLEMLFGLVFGMAVHAHAFGRSHRLLYGSLFTASHCAPFLTQQVSLPPVTMSIGKSKNLADPLSGATPEEYFSALFSGQKWRAEYAVAVIANFSTLIANDAKTSREPMNERIWRALVAVQARWDGRLKDDEVPTFEQNHQVLIAVHLLEGCFRDPDPNDVDSQKRHRWGLQLAERFARSLEGG